MNITKSGHNDEALFTAKVNKLKSIYNNLTSEILVSHIGEFNQDKINSISAFLENQLLQAGASKKVAKKIFNITIETLQNINLHGDKDLNGIQMTYFLVIKNGADYNIYSGNLVKSSGVEKLNKLLTHIKSLSEENLKKEYMEVLSHGELSEKGGAGLGFITIALKSNNNVNFEFEEIDKNYKLFSLHSKVKD